jgi:hypothetical protein
VDLKPFDSAELPYGHENFDAELNRVFKQIRAPKEGVELADAIERLFDAA